MSRLCAPFVIMFTLVSAVSLTSKEGKNEETIFGEDWLDPGDMIHYDFRKTAKESFTEKSEVALCGDLKTQLSQCRKDLENMPREHQACPRKTESSVPQLCDTPYFKKLARAVLENMEERGEHEVMVKATLEETGTLRRFVDSEKGNAQDVCEVMTSILSNFKTQYAPHISSDWDSSSFSYVTKEAVLALAFLVVILSAVIAFEARTRSSWRAQFWCILFLGFAVSVPWEWYHLYRKSFATKQANMQEDMPKHCQHDHQLNPLESWVLWFKSAFTFSDDVCIKYQETLLVDPVWEVSPLKAISAAVASTFAQMFQQIAETTGKSFRLLFKEIPIQWQPFVFIAVIIVIVLAMFMLSGLEVRLPFITITTMPAVPGNAQVKMRQIQQQVEKVEGIVQQLNDNMAQRDRIDNAPLQQDINNQQEQILQLLQEMGERQTRWQNEMQRRVEPAIAGDGSRRLLSAQAPELDEFVMVDERPLRSPVRESLDTTKLPVQNSEPSVEDVGSTEHSH